MRGTAAAGGRGGDRREEAGEGEGEGDRGREAESRRGARERRGRGAARGARRGGAGVYRAAAQGQEEEGIGRRGIRRPSAPYRLAAHD